MIEKIAIATKCIGGGEARTVILIFLGLLTSYAYFFPRWADWNQNSRLDQVMAIVDRRVLHIDDYYQNTGDYAFFEGHYYSDKAPGTAFAGVPVYALFRLLMPSGLVDDLTSHFEGSGAIADTLRAEGTGIRSDKVFQALALLVVTFFSVSVPSALLGALLYLVLGSFTSVHGVRLALTLTYGLATMAFPYAGAFMGHQIAAVCLFGSFAMAFWAGRKEQIGRAFAMVIGLLLGYAVIAEYPTVFWAAPLFFYTFVVLHDKRLILWVIAGGMLPGVLAAAYNLSIYHTPLPVAYSYSVLFPHHFQTGLMGFGLPTLETLWGLTFSLYRGLFTLSPFLVLSIPGFVVWFRSRKSRGELCVILTGAFLHFVYISGMTTWSGNYSVGPRHLCITIPFLVIPIGLLLDRSPKWTRAVFWALAMVSFGSVWIQTVSGQSYPDDVVSWPLVQYSFPRLLAGDIARNVGTALGLKRWFSLIPILSVIAGGFVWLHVLKRGSTVIAGR